MKRYFLILLITFLLLLIAGVLTMSHPTWQQDAVEITNANDLQTYFYCPSGMTAVLMNDITALKGKAFVLPKGQNATLDLYGKTITGANGIEVITIDGGNLTLKDTGNTGRITHYIPHNGTEEGRGIVIREGTFIMRGGNIIGNLVHNSGGGMYIGMKATAIIDGGKITLNAANDDGGGIYNAGTLILRNEAQITRNGAFFAGGGICNDGTVTMEGGKITQNSAETDGGGVDNRGEFTIRGGKITENIAKRGGGVVNDGNFVLAGGIITQNAAIEHSGGIFTTRQGHVYMWGGRVENNRVME